MYGEEGKIVKPSIDGLKKVDGISHHHRTFETLAIFSKIKHWLIAKLY